MEATIDPTLLKPKQPVSEEAWRLWEKKNFNLHRGVIEWTVDEEFESVHHLALRVREGVRTEFKPGWLRGFGFGTVLHVTSLSADFTEICGHIDTRNKKYGVWQWTILQFDDEKVALGLHTWLHGYLRPVYNSVLEQLAREGYEIQSADAQVDELVATLRKIKRACSPVQMVAELLG